MADRQYQDFPVPRLDDRTFSDLMEEMRALIPVYCPEWTNHNPSDPGITLLELYASMTEVMLQRLNRVPVRNLFTLLNLLGVQPKAPAASRTPLLVTPSPTAHGQVLPKGTAVASQRSGDAEPLVFETDFPVVLTSGNIVKGMTSNGQEVRDITGIIGADNNQKFEPFGGEDAKEQALYIGDPRLRTLKEEGMRVHLKFTGDSAHRDLYARWTWEIFDGESWIPAPLAVGHGRGEVVLGHEVSLNITEVNGVEMPWVRALPEPSEEDPATISFENVEIAVGSSDDGVMPNAAFLNQGGESLYMALDLTRTFFPFGETPREDACCYIMARELFKAAGTRVELHLETADVKQKPRPEATSDLRLVVEYPAQGGYWRKIGSLRASMFATDTDNPYELEDHTWGLTRAGVISFIVPDDLNEQMVQGEVGPWIRIRLAEGAYLGPPQGEGTNEIALPFDLPPTGPHFISLKLRSRSQPAPVDEVMAYSDFSFRKLWERGTPRGTAVLPFPHREEYTIALYMGFDMTFPPGTHGIYFKIADDGETYDEEYEVAIANQRVEWEYLTHEGFKPLPHVTDGTLHLKRDGYVVFDAPEDGGGYELFEEEAFWIRGRLSAGRYDVGPKIDAVCLNCPTASNQQTIKENRVLPSDGQPYQEVALRRFPVIGAVKVWVFERETPRPEVLEGILGDLGGDDAMQDGDGGIWFRWRQVEHFLESGPNGRHFRLDRNSGVIRFGDGVDGMIPPPHARGIRLESYPIGGGDGGNVGPNTVIVLKESSSMVAEVRNPFSADGGAEAESIVDAAYRGSHSIYNIDRAVRAADYERLAFQASRRVAKAYCLPPRVPSADGTEHPEDGAVRVLILPKPGAGDNAKKRLMPSQELLRRVRNYLDARRALNVKIVTRGVRYKSFSIEAALYTRSKMSQALEDELKEKLYNFLHPLIGGQDQRGWTLGGDVPRATLYQILGGNPEVLSVVSLRTFDSDGREFSGSLCLGDDELPFLSNVELKAAHLD